MDVVTTEEAGNRQVSDIQQLQFATREGRVLLSYNKRDFAHLHQKLIAEGQTHAGIIISDQLPIGTVLRRIMKLWFSISGDEMKNRLEYLSNWK